MTLVSTLPDPHYHIFYTCTLTRFDKKFIDPNHGNESFLFDILTDFVKIEIIKLLYEHIMLNIVRQQKTLYCRCDKCGFLDYCTADLSCSEQPYRWDTLVKQTIQLKKNEILLSHRHQIQSLFVIRSGALKSYQIEANGNEIVKGFYFVGEAVGYEAIHQGYYPFIISALVDTTVCELIVDDMLHLSHNKLALQKKLLSLTSEQLTKGDYLSLPTAEQRIASFLIDLTHRLLSHDESIIEITLPMSRQDIGNYLRLTAETVSRVFSRLQKMNVIALDRRYIKIIDLITLQKISDGIVGDAMQGCG